MVESCSVLAGCIGFTGLTGDFASAVDDLLELVYGSLNNLLTYMV